MASVWQVRAAPCYRKRDRLADGCLRSDAGGQRISDLGFPTQCVGADSLDAARKQQKVCGSRLPLSS